MQNERAASKQISRRATRLERNATLQERSAILQERNATLQERSAILQERNAMLQERSATPQEPKQYYKSAQSKMCENSCRAGEDFYELGWEGVRISDGWQKQKYCRACFQSVTPEVDAKICSQFPAMTQQAGSVV